MSELDKKLRLLADEIASGRRKVTFFQGAGISTSAGIPDFRSPNTGLYANLAKLNLPFAEAVFDIDYFRDNPKAFYTLAEELYPDKFTPTKFHYLIKLLQDKKLLHRVYTQNIDTLERIAGVEDKYIIEAHGSFASNHCIDCSKEMSTEKLKSLILAKDKNDGIPLCEECEGLVKPDIVFFGEGLPEKFFDIWNEDSENVDIAIVAGTSLSVYPFAALPSEISKRTLRVLINNELVGDFKINKRKSDIILLKDCDKVAEKLCELLGWSEELNNLVDPIENQAGATIKEEINIITSAIEPQENSRNTRDGLKDVFPVNKSSKKESPEAEVPSNEKGLDNKELNEKLSNEKLFQIQEEIDKLNLY